MSLLPSRPDAEPSEDAGPRVIGVDDDAADDVLAALSSGTARSLLSALHDDPAPPSELADACDTSLQNVQYHLGKLENAGAVEVVDTAYSEKGREMDVYAPADQPLVVFAGGEEDGSTLRTALARLLGAVGVLALASLLVQTLAETVPIGAPTGGDGAGGGGGAVGDGGAGGADAADGGDAAFQGETTATPADGADVQIQGGEATSTPAPTPSGDGGSGSTLGEEATRTVDVVTDAPKPAETPARTVGETVRDTTTEVATTAADGAGQAADQVAGGLPPGLLFFAGGLFVLGVVGVAWYVSTRR